MREKLKKVEEKMKKRDCHFIVSVFALTIVLTFSLLLSGCGCKHEYSSKITTPATCSSEGVLTYTCDLCGDSYTEVIEKNDTHSYTFEITKEASVLEEGSMTYTCSLCGKTYSESIPKIKSNWEIDYYIDDFGDKTDDAFVRGEFTGTFSNSATTASNLTIYVYFDPRFDSTRIKLIEYDYHLATFNTNYDTVVLKTKDTNGTTKNYVLNDYFGSGSLSCAEKALKDSILKNEELSIVITETYRGGSWGATYNFKIDNIGLKELLDSLK